MIPVADHTSAVSRFSASAHQRQVALLLETLPASEVAHLGLVTGASSKPNSSISLASGSRSLAMVIWYLIERACISLISPCSRLLTTCRASRTCQWCRRNARVTYSRRWASPSRKRSFARSAIAAGSPHASRHDCIWKPDQTDVPSLPVQGEIPHRKSWRSSAPWKPRKCRFARHRPCWACVAY